MGIGPLGSFQVRVSKRRFNKSRFFVIATIFIIGVVLAVILFKGGINNIFKSSPKDQEVLMNSTNSSTSEGTTKNGANKGTTNSSDGKTDGKDKNKVTIDYNKLKSDLENYIKAFKGKYGIYFIDLVNGTEFGINDSEEYIAASTVKIPINLYLFKKIEDGSVDPEQTMVYQSRDKEAGTGSIQYKKIGTKFTVRELSRLSIQESDNVATNMLIRLLGKQNYKNFMRQSGGTIVVDKNIFCPKDMSRYMKKVYEFQNNNKTLGDELMGYFETTIFNDRIPKLLPDGIKVAHKIGNYWGGTWGAALHDIGLVFADRPFIIAVMSKNVVEKEAYDVIANISRKAYDAETPKQ